MQGAPRGRTRDERRHGKRHERRHGTDTSEDTDTFTDTLVPVAPTHPSDVISSHEVVVSVISITIDIRTIIVSVNTCISISYSLRRRDVVCTICHFMSRFLAKLSSLNCFVSSSRLVLSINSLECRDVLWVSSSIRPLFVAFASLVFMFLMLITVGLLGVSLLGVCNEWSASE